MPPNPPPEADRHIEGWFRIAQLIRKRTFLGEEEAAVTTRRTPSTISNSLGDLGAAKLVKRIQRQGKGYYGLSPDAAWAVGVVLEQCWPKRLTLIRRR